LRGRLFQKLLFKRNLAFASGDLNLYAEAWEKLRMVKGGSKRKGSGERLDDLPSEGFSELDPAVLALEKPD